jgi:hypothetical protein
MNLTKFVPTLRKQGNQLFKYKPQITFSVILIPGSLKNYFKIWFDALVTSVGSKNPNAERNTYIDHIYQSTV